MDLNDEPTEAARVLRSKLCRDLSSDSIARSARSYRPRDYDYGFEDGSGDELFRTKRHSAYLVDVSLKYEMTHKVVLIRN